MVPALQLGLMPYSCEYGKSIFVDIFRTIASLSVVDETVDEDSVCDFGSLCVGADVIVAVVSRSVSFGG